ncbi:growth-regulating factor 1-like [Actinidia eriantha]|uniref:growth-regulating factor 1-like n=1 Tax=Actinidia eriantha TaxID=165200 RepID=UPI0025879370|nr:growth-regulating factor 1-like [Actinidia eriantha]
MDFGALDFGSLVGPDNGVSSQAVSDPEATKPNSNGSGFLKQGRSGSGQDDWRSSKVARTDDSESPNTMLHLQGTPLLLRSDSLQQNMLSFSSPRSEVSFLSKNGGSADRTPYSYARNSGYGSRGLFTPSQWVELEHQALIYKYIVANVPVPSNLLIALKNSLHPYGLSGLSSRSYAPNTLGWGSFHLGFSGNTDPEPGRCRRTDGKKWRCSRDAVADQKYCERHLNRGRHRSRKPVEGQIGQAVTGSTPKVGSIVCSTSASVMPSSGASNSLGITKYQFKGLQTGAEHPSADVLVSRMQVPRGLSVISPTTDLKSKGYPFSIPKPHNPLEESSNSGFGIVSSDSLLNPSQKNYMSSTNYNPILDLSNCESHDQHPLRHFIDEWPKDQSNRATIAWPDEFKSDWTQLSMSIPMAASDFSSTSSSPPQEKIALSPFRPSHELNPIQMGLTVNNHFSDSTEKPTNRMPISWGSSMGGPLGEVLNSTSSVSGPCKKSALNLTTRAWNGSPQLGSSPTGVLQKTTFVSLSNSSSGSSPRADKKQGNGIGSLGDDMLNSTLVSSFSIPSL